MNAFAASNVVGGGDGSMYAFSVCMRSRLPRWWGKRTHVYVYELMASPLVGEEDECVYAFSVCMR